MAENKKRTLNVIREELNSTVDKLNKHDTDVSQTNGLLTTKDKLVKEYNDLSLLTVYCNARNAQFPVMEIAKAKAYGTVSVPKPKDSYEVNADGEVIAVSVYSVKDGKKDLNVLQFIKWLEERNVKLPDGWYKRMQAARDEVKSQWLAFRDVDEPKFYKNQCKRAFQPMLDDLCFHAGATGQNAFRFETVDATYALEHAHNMPKASTGIDDEFLTNAMWEDMLMHILGRIANSGKYAEICGEEALYKDWLPTDAAPAATADASTEATAEEPATK